MPIATASAHLFHVVRTGGAAHDDDRERARTFARLKPARDLQTIEAVMAAKAKIEHDDLGRQGAGKSERFVPVVGELNAHSAFGRYEFIRKQRVRVIIDK